MRVNPISSEYASMYLLIMGALTRLRFQTCLQ